MCCQHHWQKRLYHPMGKSARPFGLYVFEIGESFLNFSFDQILKIELTLRRFATDIAGKFF